MKTPKPAKKALTPAERQKLLATLKSRFEANMPRHPDLAWSQIQSKLESHPEKLWSLNEMERTGGEPDVIAFDKKTNQYTFCDCSPESPSGRRSICYDRQAQKANIKGRPDAKDNALDLAANMGIDVLDEAQYRHLQSLGPFDTKSQSWLQTPPEIRTLGGAIFGDFRYGQVFVYHNGPQSYYAARAFRGSLRV